MYDTPKRHKLKSPTDTLTFHPIVSFVGTYNYKLVKLLTDMLDPVVPIEYCAKDLFSFLKEIQMVNFSRKIMLLYDACSLFISITLKEAIGIAVNSIFDKYPDSKLQDKNLKNHLNLKFLEYTLFLMVTFMSCDCFSFESCVG